MSLHVKTAEISKKDVKNKYVKIRQENRNLSLFLNLSQKDEKSKNGLKENLSRFES
jgi:hypothetical protein